MKEKVRIGTTKKENYGRSIPVYLEDFSWDCNWYWGGGYITNKYLHTHFNSCFLEIKNKYHPLGIVTDISNNCYLWENVSKFLDNSPFEDDWWRIKDLFIQFYSIKKSAEVFKHGGHCISKGRTDEELNDELYKSLNLHLQNVIIPEIRNIFGFKSESPKLKFKQ